MSEYDYVFPNKPSHEKRSETPSNVMNGLIFLTLLVSFFVLFDVPLIILGVFIAVLLIHELGHFIAMKLLGYQNVSLRIVPMFGVSIQGEKSMYSQRQKILVALAGAIPSLAIAVLLMIFIPDSFYFSNEMAWFIAALIVVNVLNLLPLDMFDGGRFIENIFFISKDHGKFIFTLITSVLIILIGIYFQNIYISAFGFILGLKVRSLHKLKDIRAKLKKIDVNFRSSFEKLSNRGYWLIREEVINQSKTLKEIVPDLRSTWENEPLLMHEVEGILEIPVKQDVSILEKIFYIILWLAFLIYPVYLFLSSNILDKINVF